MVVLPLQTKAICRPASAIGSKHVPRAQMKGFGPKSMAILPFAIAGPAFAEDEIADAIATVKDSVSSVDYDTIVNQSTKALQDTVGSLDNESLLSIVNENPALVIGGSLALVALPVIPALISNANKGYGGNVSANVAVEMMKAATKAVLVDVRAKQVVKVEGVPALRGTGATRLAVPIKVLTPEGKEVINDSFIESVVKSNTLKGAMNKESEKVLLIVADSSGSMAAQGAALKLAEAGFGKNVFTLKGGLTGPSGWQDSDLPWKEPFDFSLPSLSIPEINKETAVLAFGAAAAVGAGAFVFTEFETLLELVGSVAALQIFINKFLFADDREKTTASVKEWLDTKVMPQELASDIRGIISTTVADTGLVTDEEKEDSKPEKITEADDETSATEMVAEEEKPQVNVNVQ